MVARASCSNLRKPPNLSTLALRVLVGLVFSAVLFGTVACGTDQACGSGSWRPGRLEIHHLPMGQADGTLIVAPSGRSLLVDTGETTWDRRAGAELVAAAIDRTLGCRQIDSAVITHFHLDHVGAPGRGGLAELVASQGVSIGVTYHRNLWRFSGAGATVGRWREFLASPSSRSLHPRIIDAGTQIDLGPEVAVRVVAVDGMGALYDAPVGDLVANENDHSVALHLRFGRLDYFIGGDLSGEYVVGTSDAAHDIETAAARHLPDIDVYRVNHHGSNHSSNATFLAQIDPEVSIISVGAPSPHGHPGASALDRLLATGAVYLTTPRTPRRDLGAAVAGGEIVLSSADGNTYSIAGTSLVNGTSIPFSHDYVASDPSRTDADGDGYYAEADPDDRNAQAVPDPVGGCDLLLQPCGP
jgi:beta-lactamase superfamily II metal-dependent hydrolase